MIKPGERAEIAKQAYGSNRWYALAAGAERHPANALWLRTEGDGIINTNDGRVQSDGLARFFKRKIDVVNAIWRTKETK